MATLQQENFSRWTINSNGGSSNNCFPSIVATFLQMDTTAAENQCIGFPARTGRQRGGTRIEWSNPAQQVTDSFGVGAEDMFDMTQNNRFHVQRQGTTAQVARGLSKGVYVVIHKGHAYGLIVTNGKAYTVDYGSGNAARRVVWTCTRLEGVNPDTLLQAFRSPKPKAKGFSSEGELNKTFKRRTMKLEQTPEPKPEPKSIRVYTRDGELHLLQTANDSREFVRAYGDDTCVLPKQWDEIHDLQF